MRNLNSSYIGVDKRTAPCTPEDRSSESRPLSPAPPPGAVGVYGLDKQYLERADGEFRFYEPVATFNVETMDNTSNLAARVGDPEAFIAYDTTTFQLYVALGSNNAYAKYNVS